MKEMITHILFKASMEKKFELGFKGITYGGIRQQLHAFTKQKQIALDSGEGEPAPL